jgi:DNA-binding PadR family transcriptional regulator
MSVQNVLLGVLAEGPMHGYDLKRAYDDRFPGAKPLAYGQVYSSLSRLEQEGMVEIAETSQDGGPERTAYALTARGRERLHGWLAETEPPGPYAAVDLVRKTTTALRLGADAGGILQRQRAEHLDAMRALLRVQADVDDPGARIAIDHTIFHLDADLKWLETAAARVAAEGTGRP